MEFDNLFRDQKNGHKPKIEEGSVLALLEEAVPDAMLLSGHDNAIIGYIERYGQESIACYDYHKVIENLMAMMGEGESEEERYEMAVEWYEYNIIGAWVGDGTPCFLVKSHEFSG
jgi:hypothetical protein